MKKKVVESENIYTEFLTGASMKMKEGITKDEFVDIFIKERDKAVGKSIGERNEALDKMKTGTQVHEESMKEWYKNQDFTLEKKIHDEMFGTATTGMDIEPKDEIVVEIELPELPKWTVSKEAFLDAFKDIDKGRQFWDEYFCKPEINPPPEFSTSAIMMPSRTGIVTRKPDDDLYNELFGISEETIKKNIFVAPAFRRRKGVSGDYIKEEMKKNIKELASWNKSDGDGNAKKDLEKALEQLGVPMPKGDMEFEYPGKWFGRTLFICNLITWGSILLFIWWANK